MTRYATYKTGVISYTISSSIPGFPLQSGYFYVENIFPGKHRTSDYKLGETWWTDRQDPSLFSDKEKCQGAKTVSKWRIAIMEDWGKRCQWLK